ncbi:MAG: hypothetical protein HRU46_14765 [Verrucomicrobiales bacterium]|nr:hypothetical protein [Verrucomicrobiales bacterium]
MREERLSSNLECVGGDSVSFPLELDSEVVRQVIGSHFMTFLSCLPIAVSLALSLTTIRLGFSEHWWFFVVLAPAYFGSYSMMLQLPKRYLESRIGPLKITKGEQDSAGNPIPPRVD